jgi:hypothetical protein
VNGLNLMTVRKVSMMSRFDFIIVIISVCCRELMLCCGLKVMRRFPMVPCGLMVNVMFVFSGHFSFPG